MSAKKAQVEPVKVDPDEVLQRYRALVPAETYACILEGLNHALPQALRVNRLQGAGEEEMLHWQAH